VLHNVGNVLNSVNVASACIEETIRKSKSEGLSKAAALLREHETDLASFLTDDPRGRRIPGYLSQLSEQITHEHEAVLAELADLKKSIEHIKEIVASQQNHAKIGGVVEVMKVAELVEDSLKMNASTHDDVRIIKEIDRSLAIRAEKHRVLQILVNLVRNAKQSCQASDAAQKRLVIRAINQGNQVQIAVSDNGLGIQRENLNRIFTHGFTTKKNGHGFGLYSSLTAAKEMGGTLRVDSEGPGEGATFTLELPAV